MAALASLVWGMARALACFGLILLLGFALATLLDGLFRTYLDAPIEAVRDLGPLVAAVGVSACFPLAVLEKSNIRIHLFDTRLSPQARLWLERIVDVLTILVMAAIARQILVYAHNAQEGGDATVMLEWSTAPFWYVVGACMVIAVASQVVQFVAEARGVVVAHRSAGED